MTTLDLAQLKADYDRDGYLRIEGFFPPDMTAELKAETEGFCARAREGALTEAVYDVIDTDAGKELRRITEPQEQSAVYDAAMRYEPLLDLVEHLLGGAGIRFDHGKLNFKPPSGGGALDWHQDFAFYPQTNDDMLAVGVYLEDCDEVNGPLMVIPGSHKAEIWDHHADGVFAGGVPAAALGDLAETAVGLTGRAGSITIHHSRTLHASRENRGTVNRPLLLFNYFAPDAFPIMAGYEWDAFNARLLRGEPVWTPRIEPIACKAPLPRIVRDNEHASASIFFVQERLKGGAILEEGQSA